MLYYTFLCTTYSVTRGVLYIEDMAIKFITRKHLTVTQLSINFLTISVKLMILVESYPFYVNSFSLYNKVTPLSVCTVHDALRHSHDWLLGGYIYCDRDKSF